MTTKTQEIARTAHDVIERGSDMAHSGVNQTAAKAEVALDQTQRVAHDTEKTLRAGFQQLGEAVPATLSRAASQAEDLARSGIEKARAAGTAVTEQANRAGEKTVSYVREEPAKALLMAAAAGAAATLLVGWATRARAQRN